MKVDPKDGAIRRDADGRVRAILVGLELPSAPESFREPLEELRQLADTAGADTVDSFVQRRQKPFPATYIGKGKAEEVAERRRELDAELVIFDADLSPSQSRNLEKIIGGRVIDRTELILDIFVNRASTALAKLQVELAQMEYTLPRLKRLWTHLNREVGMGGKAGIGLRGPGEKQLETDRRLVRTRIRDLKRVLDQKREHRERQTRARSRWFTACFVGYTNAGKSTLLHALTGADVFMEDRLFATLDTTTRSWEIASGKRVFLSDTVGFIRDLPHHLVSSFLATLEEARQADLLLHVVDAADPDAAEHVDVVEETLSEIGAGGVPRITVLNQIDRVRDPILLRLLEEPPPRDGPHQCDHRARASRNSGMPCTSTSSAVTSTSCSRRIPATVDSSPSSASGARSTRPTIRRARSWSGYASRPGSWTASGARAPSCSRAPRRRGRGRRNLLIGLGQAPAPAGWVCGSSVETRSVRAQTGKSTSPIRNAATTNTIAHRSHRMAAMGTKITVSQCEAAAETSVARGRMPLMRSHSQGR